MSLLHKWIMALITGALYGGIHLLAWDHQFDGATQAQLWRGSCIYNPLAPLTLPIFVITMKRAPGPIAFPAAIMLAVLVHGYAAARGYLIVATLLELSHAPASGLASTHIPFLGP